MRKKMRFGGLACLLGGCLMLGACSSEEGGALVPEGKGAVNLSLSAETAFEQKTKAVDEDAYLTAHPTSGYKVKLLKDGQASPVNEWLYSNIPSGLIELSNGSYTVVAYDGEEYNTVASTRDGIYMYGSTKFDVNSDQVATVKVNCTPACGKLIVDFGDDMATYFSDYAVHFSTKASGENGTIILPKADDNNPLYVKLDEAGESVTATFHVTKKDGTQANINPLTRTMKWGSRWTITVNPKKEDTTGKVGITISFDDSTNNKPIDIEIPSDWL